MFGLSTNNALFALNTGTHETAWTQPLGGAEPPRGGPFGPGGRGRGPGGPGDGPRSEGQPGDRADASAADGDPGAGLFRLTDG